MVEDGKMSIANTPFFSIVVPVFNTDQKYLKRCFESIDSQDGPSFEVLVVDDGSTNGAGQYCDEWAAQHPHFRVLHQGNSGVSTARNKGISNAVGDYVLFVDSDDYLMPNALNTFSENMSVGSADMCITDVSISDGEKHTTARVFPDQTAHFLTNQEQRKCLLQIIAGIGASFVGANIEDALLGNSVLQTPVLRRVVAVDSGSNETDNTPVGIECGFLCSCIDSVGKSCDDTKSIGNGRFC